jgi:hypothetical protein
MHQQTSPVTRSSQPPPSEPPSESTEDDVLDVRAHFAAALNRRLDELGVPERERTTWIKDRVGGRWQTAQFWLKGKTFPLGHSLTKLARALAIEPYVLVPPQSDQNIPPPPAWAAFRKTPEGQSMTDEERWLLRLFAWPKPPVVADYRALLVVVRNNSER